MCTDGERNHMTNETNIFKHFLGANIVLGTGYGFSATENL
jgi:hypothetical protein